MNGITTSADERMAELTRAFHKQSAEIRRDPDLSPEGRANALERLWQKTTAQLDTLETKGQQSATARRAQLERDIFWPGRADDLSRRDAADRAAQLRRPQDAEAALVAASSRGDLTAERAIVEHIWQQTRNPTTSSAWGRLLDDYAAQNNLTDELDELRSLTEGAGLSAALHRRLATRPTKPIEIRGRR